MKPHSILPRSIALLLVSCAISSAESGKSIVLEDALTPSPSRAAGTPLLGSSNQSIVWTDSAGAASIIITDQGATVDKADTNSMAAAVALPAPVADMLTVEADLKPASIDWLGLGLITPERAIFWNKLALLAFLRPSGAYGIMANQGGNLKMVVQGKPDGPFKPADYNHVTLTYDKAKNVVSLKINDSQVVENQPVGEALPEFSQAGIIFNGPKEPNLSQIQKFSVSSAPNN